MALLLGAAPAAGQLDPSGAWRTLHTAHFRIHFRPAYRNVALSEAREAERSYALLAAELHPPRGRIDITLDDDADFANGLTTAFPSNRITLLIAPPAADPELQMYDSWLRLVTTHELTHAFHLDRTRSLWRAAQRVFGRQPWLFPNTYQPTWVIEGLAVYYESKFTNGGRVRGSFHTQILAADHAAGVSRPPADALLFTRWADGYVPYAYGSRFFTYLATTAGDSVAPRFVEATAGQLIPYRVGRQIGRVAPGRSLGEAWPVGTAPLPGPALPDAPRGRVIASALRSEPLPRVSPDGGRVAYLWDDGKGAAELRVLEAASLREVAAHAVNAGVSYDWLGDTLLVAQLDYASPWRIRSDLYRWVPGKTWRRTTHGARLVEPAAGGGHWAALTLGAATNRPTVAVPAGSSGATWGEVVPSPDGRWLAASRHSDGHWTLVRWPAEWARTAGTATVLVASRGVIAEPVWTQQGELWFTADPTGFPQVYRWCDSGFAEPLTAEPLGARGPAALGDGTLLYTTLTAAGWALRQAAPVRGGARAEFPAPVPFDSAPPVPVRETGYALWPSLRPHFWIPFFVNAGPSGHFGGPVTAGTDALGRFSYTGELFLSPAPVRAAGAFTLVSHTFAQPTLDFSGSSTWLNVLPPPGAPALTLSELHQTAVAGGTLFWRRWRGLASVRGALEFERFRYTTRPDTSLPAVCPGCAPQDLLGGSLTLGLSRLVLGALSVSPENGFAWSATYRRRQQAGSALWSNELRSQLDLYAGLSALGGFAHHVLALRLAAGATSGPIASVYTVGGVSQRSVSLGFGLPLGVSRLFPVRGYANTELSGIRAATGTVEYRLPLALVGHSLGHLPLGDDRVWLNLFADVGDAWSRGAKPELTRLRSTGLELASDVAVNYDLLVGLRLGVGEPLAAPPSGRARHPRVYLAFASDF